MKRSETTGTDTSSGSNQSMQDVQSTSSTTNDPTCSEVVPLGQSRPGTSSGSTGRKRKVPDSVTPNACTNCKRARAKCDGAKPSCRRCAQRKIQDLCHYELHAKTAKEQMIREIQRLQRKNEHLEEENDSLGERNNWIEKIMRSLKDDGQGIEIIQRLKRGESHKTIAEWLGRPLSGEMQDMSPITEIRLTEAIEQYHRELVESHDPRYWTNVTADVVLIEHLVTLYLTWIHPVHMLFDEGHFVKSFKQCSDVYCSSSLVNIICAMSCHLLHSTWDDDEETRNGIYNLRSKFLEETRSLMKNAEVSKMTSIQTYAIMFLVELGSGQGLIASSHLRLATESLITKQTSEQTSESEEVAAWGILTLHTAWSGFTYQKPTAPISTHAHPFENLDLRQLDSVWRLYRQPGDSSLVDRPSFAILTASEHAKLFRIIHETILVYCGSRGRVSARSLLDLYDRYLAWREGLPPDIATVNNETLPHVMFLHVQYYTAIVHLLQPLLALDQYLKASYNALQNAVVEHAKAGMDLLMRYRAIYSNYYLSPLQLFCMVHLCDAVVHFSGEGAATPITVHFCLASLSEAKRGYPVAGPLQNMFRVTLVDYRIPISKEMEELIGPAAQIGLEELLDACTRPTYRQPMVQILPNTEPGLGQSFMDEWEKMSLKPVSAERPRAGSAGKENRMGIPSLLNQ